MTLKDKINKVSAVGLISSAAIIASGYVLENKELFGFENAMLLYLYCHQHSFGLVQERMDVEVVIKFH